MPIIAGSIVVGELVIKKAEAVAPRNGVGSFQALRESLYAQLLSENKQPINKNTSTYLPKRKREVNNSLIQYKESAFLSDMLSSSKD